MALSPGQPLLPSLADFSPASLRGRPGFFRAGRTFDGAWWLIDPFDRGFFAKAVTAVNDEGRPSSAAEGQGSLDYLRQAVPRLRGWNFNTLGAWSSGVGESGMYGVAVLNLKQVGPRIHLCDTDLPDVFDPTWLAAARDRAGAVCGPLAHRREVIGYFSDDDLRWAMPDGQGQPGRPGLLQVCLSLEPYARAYHAAWEFVLARRRGDLARLGRDWGLPLPNREAVRQLTLAEVGLRGRAYWQDEYQFTREFARRYHTLAARVIREHDENHLLLGCRWRGLPGEAVLKEASYPACDVLSLQVADFEDWGDHLAALSASYEGPLWFCGVGWHAHPALEDALPPTAAQVLDRRLREGSQALQTLVADAMVVGYEWGAWRHPADAAPYFLGLVRPDEQPVPEHTEVLRALNGQVERWRRNAGPTQV